jgi:mono/diheme cytochrome c family protein
MPISRVSIALLVLALIPIAAGARDGLAIWDSRCEECHGDPAVFAGEYLWVIDGQLQGQHHVDNLSLFMGNHYIPDHEIDAIGEMLQARANSAVRFITECASCHGDASEFVEKSLWVTRGGVTGMESGMEVSEFLPTHQDLQPDDVVFYRKLFARIAGKPLP